MVTNIADALLILLVVFVLVSFFLLRKEQRSKKFYFLLFTIIIFLSLYVFREYILDYLKTIPFVWMLIGPILYEISKNSLLGLFYLSAFGALFFISIPMEIIFIYYFSLGYNPFIIIAIASIGSMTGIVFNYSFGFVLGEKMLKNLLKQKYDKFKNMLEKFGGLILFFGNAVPSPVELASVVFGATRYSFKKFFIYSLLGRIAKFSLILYLGDILTKTIIPYIKSFL